MVPKHVSDAQREALEAFEAASTGSPRQALFDLLGSPQSGGAGR
ncbi:unannotated protein [freshwater metagenome]|uniref:Unannotated protein n=1 Tax=freshwater metagenome TaxID=449393 RepID=A0A6J6S2W0_9ZZZZ